jgi:hypothetical protein
MDCFCDGRIEGHDLCREYKRIAPPKKSREEVFAPDGVVVRGTVSCDLCDIYDNVNHHCVECNQNLCNWCNHLHLRSKASFKHHPVSIKLWEKHKESMQCPIHKDWQQNIYCCYCCKFVCGQCGKNPNTPDTRPCKVFNSKKEEIQHRLNLLKQGTITMEGITEEEHKIYDECLKEDKKNQINLVDQVQAKIQEEIEESRDLIFGYRERLENWYTQICDDFVAKIKKYKKKAAPLHGKELIRLYKFAQNDINKPREHVPPIYNIPPPRFVPGRPGVWPIEEQFGRLEYDNLHILWRKHILLYNFLCTN